MRNWQRLLVCLLGFVLAHMIGNLLTAYAECKGFMHGEKVAFGIITQLCLDDEMDVQQRNKIVVARSKTAAPLAVCGRNASRRWRGRS